MEPQKEINGYTIHAVQPLTARKTTTLEAICVRLLYSLTWTGFSSLFSFMFIFVLLICPILWPLLVLYPLWLWYDWGTPSQGGRPIKYCYLQKWRIFNVIRDYYPITLIKTTELNPNKNYIIGYHPHGMLPEGALVCFSTEAGGFTRLFPGITPRVAMTSAFEWLPALREMVMAVGIISVSRNSIEHLLTKQGRGQAAIIVIGGATEVLCTSPASYCLILNRRKGFIKLALETGSSLVPVVAFGQNDLFHQPPSDMPSRFPGVFTKWPRVFLKYALLAFNDRSTFGIMPRRAPITVVVGAPIEVERVSYPTYEHIEELHSAYVAELKELFEAHKVKYGVPKHTQLVLDE